MHIRKEKSYGAASKEYLIEVIKYYRRINFFSKYKSFSNEEILDRAKRFILGNLGIDIEEFIRRKKRRRYADILLLSFDKERVWSEEDLEKQCNDKMDIGEFLIEVNEIIKEHKYKFQVTAIDNSIFAVILSEDEKIKLEEDRGMEFFPKETIEWIPFSKIENLLKEVKGIYGKWRFFQFILFFISSIALGYFFYKILNSIPELWLSNVGDNIYFYPPDMYYWVLISIFIGTVGGGYTSEWLINSILQERSEGYQLYMELFNLENKLSRKLF